MTVGSLTDAESQMTFYDLGCDVEARARAPVARRHESVSFYSAFVLDTAV